MQQFDRNFLSFSSLHLQTHQYLHSLLLRKSRCLLPVSKTPNSLFLSYQSSTGFFPTAHNMPLTAAVLQGKGEGGGLLVPPSCELFALVPAVTNLSRLRFSRAGASCAHRVSEAALVGIGRLSGLSQLLAPFLVCCLRSTLKGWWRPL